MLATSSMASSVKLSLMPSVSSSDFARPTRASLRDRAGWSRWIVIAVALCGPVGDCNAVQQSTYARLFGVLPVAYVGMAGYLLIGVALGISRFASRTAALAAARALFLLTLCGALFSIYLTALEPFAIGATCAWCLSSAVIVTLLLLLNTSGVRPDRQRDVAAATPPSDVADA